MNPNVRKALTAAAELPQCDETWEVTVRRALAWVQDGFEAPYRPAMVLVVAPGPVIPGAEMLGPPVRPDDVAGAIAEAMTKPGPGSGRPRRPAAIHTDDEGLAQALGAILADIGVTVSFADDMLNAGMAWEALSAMMAGDSSPMSPGLSAVPGVSEAMAARLYAHAAEYDRASPWRTLADECPFEVRVGDMPARYAVIMGAGGETFGLAAYDDLEHLKRVFSADEMHPAAVMALGSTTALMFEDAPFLAFEEIDAIDARGWEIAEDDAYPVIVRTRDAVAGLPSLADLEWLEAALPALVQFLAGRSLLTRGHRPRPADATVTVETHRGPVEVYVRFPAFDPYV